MLFLTTWGVGSFKGGLFLLAENAKTQKKCGVVARNSVILLTFDKYLYIGGNEKNYCFICVGFLYVKTESAFRKGETKESKGRCMVNGR